MVGNLKLMKMNRIHIVSLVMALAAFISCVPDSRDDRMPESAVYFVDNAWNNGPQLKTIYSLEKGIISVPVGVYGSGFTTSEANVTATGDDSYVDYYNSVKGTSLKSLPADCWSLENNSLTVKDRRAVFSLAVDAKKVFDFAANNGLDYEEMKDYVIALRLDSDNSNIGAVKDTASLGYYMLAPDLKDAVIKVTSEQISARVVDVTVALTFTNDKYNVSYELDFGKEGVSSVSQSRGNYFPAKYRCAALPSGVQISNEDKTSMAPGTEKITYRVTFPDGDIPWEKGRTNSYKFSIKNAMLDAETHLDVEDASAIVTVGNDNSFQRLVSTVGNGTNYPGGFNATELALLGNTLSDKGFVSYGDGDVDKDWYWHPQSSCQYGGRDMCKYGPFDHKSDDWGVAYNANGYGLDALRAYPNAYSWGLIDMNEVRAVEGIEYWRKYQASSVAHKGVRDFEFYALDACTYEKLQPVLEWKDEDATYLGSASFGDSDYTQNILAATFDRTETQYLLILFKNGNQQSYHAIEMKVLY